MRFGKKLLLGVMGVVVPVIVAACYGVPYRFSKSGKVVDKTTGQGVPSLDVVCVSGNNEADLTVTGVDGVFDLWYDQACDAVLIRDVDGDTNGVYGAQRVDFCEDCDPWVIEIDQEL